VRRILQRTIEVMKEHPGQDVRKFGAIDLDTVQKYVNFWYSISLDLFGGEISTNAADFFGAGLKGRAFESRNEDHVALQGTYEMTVPEGGEMVTKQVPLRNAMNEILRDGYAADNQRGVDMWNKTLAKEGIEQRLNLPSRRFHRNIGIYSSQAFTPEGEMISREDFAARQDEWLPSTADREYINSLMQKVIEPGKIAGWIAPPAKGINSKSFDFEYVRLD
jgi:benzoyl-CoA 2,3-dioxygenase component B